MLADDPLRAVQVLPGVATGDDLRSEFSVRGSDFTHMNMTVDGFSTPFLLHTVRAVEDRSSSGSVAMINSDILEDVTLLNGGYAQRYGDRTGAELDFRLREGSRERRQARVAVSGTSASVVGEGPDRHAAKRGSWLVTARQSYLQLLVERLYDDGEGFNFGFPMRRARSCSISRRRSGRSSPCSPDARSSRSAARISIPRICSPARNASAIAIGTWRLTKPRGILTARALSALNRFSNDTIDCCQPRQRARQGSGGAGSTPASPLDGHVQADAGAQAEWTDETRFRQRFSGALGRYRTINDFTGAAHAPAGTRSCDVTAGTLTLVPGARADHWTFTR